MNAITSKLSSKSQTVIPRVVREKLGVKPGDHLRYRYTEAGVVIEREVDDPEWSAFDPVAFWEWGTAEDDAAFAHLQPKTRP